MAVYTSLAPNIHHPLHAKMNNDPYAGRSYLQREEGATIFSRIKSIWSQTAEFNDFDSKYNKTTLQVPNSRSSSDKNSNLSFLDMSGAIPRNSRRFSDVKRIFTFTNLNFARSSASKSINIRIHTHFESEQFLDSETSSGNHTVSPRYYFTALDTPPLTPDSINQDQTVLDSPDSTISIANHRTQDDAYPSLQLGKHTQDEDHAQDTRDLSLSQQVKNSEGKKPQRPIVSLQLLQHRELIFIHPQCHDSFITHGIPPPVSTESSSEEWYGIEYAIQQSRHDMQGLFPCSQPSAGEYSKVMP